MGRTKIRVFPFITATLPPSPHEIIGPLMACLPWRGGGGAIGYLTTNVGGGL